MPVDAAELLDRLEPWLEQVLEYALNQLGDELTEACPVSEGTGDNSPGTLRDSLEIKQSGLTAAIEYPPDYASYVSEGTDPHQIDGNPVLSFYWPKIGKVVTVRSVQHPGTAPNPWWDTLVTEDHLVELLDDAAETIPF